VYAVSYIVYSYSEKKTEPQKGTEKQGAVVGCFRGFTSSKIKSKAKREGDEVRILLPCGFDKIVCHARTFDFIGYFERLLFSLMKQM
jgi:hypothetical protein